MIYSTQKAWNELQSNHRFKVDSLVILDLSVLKQLREDFQKLSSQINQPVDKLIKGFEEMVISVHEIKGKVNVIVLNYERFTQQMTPLPDSKFHEGANQFEVLKNIYTTSINLGINIPVEQLQTFHIKEEYLKSIKLYSINISMANHQKQFPLIRNFIIKHLKLPNQLLQIHLTLQKPQDLQIFQREIIENNYPIQYIIVSSNLLSVISIQSLYSKYEDLDQQEIQEHKFYHCNRYYEKFLNSSLFNILDYQTAIPLGWNNSTQQNQKNFNKILKNFVDLEYPKKLKKVHKGGLIVPATLFLNAIKQYRGNPDNFHLVHTSLDRSIFIPLRKVIQGDFKSIQSTISTN